MSLEFWHAAHLMHVTQPRESGTTDTHNQKAFTGKETGKHWNGTQTCACSGGAWDTGAAAQSPSPIGLLLFGVGALSQLTCGLFSRCGDPTSLFC